MKLAFMLDTDTVSYAMRGAGDVGAHLKDLSPSAVCLSSITVAELRYGADLDRSRKIHRAIDAFTSSVQIIPFDEVAARQFGHVAAALAHAGTPIGDFDALIASHAVARDLTLVTNNTKHFSLVAGLTIVNWLKKAV